MVLRNWEYQASASRLKDSVMVSVSGVQRGVSEEDAADRLRQRLNQMGFRLIYCVSAETGKTPEDKKMHLRFTGTSFNPDKPGQSSGRVVPITSNKKPNPVPQNPVKPKEDINTFKNLDGLDQSKLCTYKVKELQAPKEE